MKYTPNLNLKKPDKEDFYDVDDFNANADILDDAVGSGSSNLLVNPDFNVNTNGQASYTGTADVETVTKWMSRSSDTTVTVTANGITVASGGSADAGIYQSVLPFAKYSDNEFVVTAYIGGEKYSAKGKAGSCEVVETDFTLAVEQMGTDVAVVIKVNATASINVENVALEVKGTFSPANYYDELGKSGYLVSNPNLLINPDFKINQRGQSSYSHGGTPETVGTYTVDRWGTINGSVTVEVIDSGLRVTNSDASSTNAGIVQLLEMDFAKYLSLELTLSAKINGQIRSITKPSGEDYKTKILDDCVIGLRVWAGNRVGVTIRALSQQTITIEWAKLELGGVATPFVPPLIVEELPKCMRYYEKCIAREGSIKINKVDADNIIFYCSFKENKRVTPTITETLSHNYIYVNNNAVYGFSYTYGAWSSGKGYSVVAKKTSHGYGTNNTALIPEAYISADAEIY